MRTEALTALPVEVAAAALAEMPEAQRLAAMLPLEGQMFLRLLLALPPKAAAEALAGCRDDGIKKTYLTTVKPDLAATVLSHMSAQDTALVLAPAPQSVRVPILAALSKAHPEAFHNLLLMLPPIAQARALLTLDPETAGAALGELPVDKRKAAVLAVSGADRALLVSWLDPAKAAELLDALSQDQAVEMLLAMTVDRRAAVLGDPGLSAQRLGAYLQALPPDERCAVLATMPPQRLARALGALPSRERVAALAALPLHAAAGALSVTRPQDSAAALASLEPAAAQSVLSAMPSRERFLAIEKLKPQLAASLVAAMPLPERVEVLSGVAPAAAAQIQRYLAPTDLRRETLSALPPEVLVAILDTLRSSADQAGLLACLDPAVAAKVLEKLPTMEQRGAVFGALPSAVANQLLQAMSPALRGEVLSHSTVPRILEALRALPPAEQVATAGKLHPDKLAAALCIAEPQERVRFLQELPPGAVAGALRSMSPRDRAATVAAMAHEQAAVALDHLSAREQGDILSSLTPSLAAAVMVQMPPQGRAAALADVSPQRVAAIIAELKPETRAETIRLLTPSAAAALLSGALPADRMPLLETFSPEQAAAGLGAMTRHERRESLKILKDGDTDRLAEIVRAMPTAEARAEALSLVPAYLAADILATMRPDEREAAMDRMPIDNAAAAKALLISPEKRAEAIMKIVSSKQAAKDGEGKDGQSGVADGTAAGVKEYKSQLESRVKESGGHVPTPAAHAVAPLLQLRSNDLAASSGARAPMSPNRVSARGTARPVLLRGASSVLRLHRLHFWHRAHIFLPPPLAAPHPQQNSLNATSLGRASGNKPPLPADLTRASGGSLARGSGAGPAAQPPPREERGSGDFPRTASGAAASAAPAGAAGAATAVGHAEKPGEHAEGEQERKAGDAATPKEGGEAVARSPAASPAAAEAQPRPSPSPSEAASVASPSGAAPPAERAALSPARAQSPAPSPVPSGTPSSPPSGSALLETASGDASNSPKNAQWRANRPPLNSRPASQVRAEAEAAAQRRAAEEKELEKKREQIRLKAEAAALAQQEEENKRRAEKDAQVSEAADKDRIRRMEMEVRGAAGMLDLPSLRHMGAQPVCTSVLGRSVRPIQCADPFGGPIRKTQAKKEQEKKKEEERRRQQAESEAAAIAASRGGRRNLSSSRVGGATDGGTASPQ